MLDIRPTSEASLDYLWFGRSCLEHARRTGMPGARAMRDGQLLIICKYTIDHATLLTLSRGDFAMHPRSGKVAKLPYYDNSGNLYTLTGINGGGYARIDGSFSELATRWIYPLKDGDRGTFLITIDNEEVEVEWAGSDSENYGNIWWVGQGDNPPVLSWRGPPSVQFPISGSYNIPGLSQAESISGGKSYYTVFGCYIYRDGAVLCHGPQWFSDDEVATLVVGACYSAEEAGEEWLVAVTITRKGAGSFELQVWRSSDEGAKWNLLNEFAATGRARVPAFIDPAGKVFVYDGVRYTIDATVSAVAIDARTPSAGKGTKTIIGTGGYKRDYIFTGKGYVWPGINAAGKLAYSVSQANATFLTTGDDGATPQTESVPVYRGNPATTVTIRMDNSISPPCSGGSGTNVVFVADVNGAYCTAEWSGVDCCKGLTAAKNVSQCNTNYSVSVTIKPQNITATYVYSEQTSDMVITGDVNLALNNQYSVANAFTPVTWGISKGVIDPDTGIITSMEGAECGTATVTATDACGRTASMTVKCPNGIWVLDPTWVEPAHDWYDENASFCFTWELVCGQYKYRFCRCTVPNGGWTYGCPPSATYVPNAAAAAALIASCGLANYVDTGNTCQVSTAVHGRYIWSCSTP